MLRGMDKCSNGVRPPPIGRYLVYAISPFSPGKVASARPDRLATPKMVKRLNPDLRLVRAKRYVSGQSHLTLREYRALERVKFSQPPGGAASDQERLSARALRRLRT